jgi:hypothetical protein
VGSTTDDGTPQSEHAQRDEVVVGWPARDSQGAHRDAYSRQRPEVHGTGTRMSACGLWAEHRCRPRHYGNDSRERQLSQETKARAKELEYPQG